MSSIAVLALSRHCPELFLHLLKLNLPLNLILNLQPDLVDSYKTQPTRTTKKAADSLVPCVSLTPTPSVGVGVGRAKDEAHTEESSSIFKHERAQLNACSLVISSVGWQTCHCYHRILLMYLNIVNCF